MFSPATIYMYKNKPHKYKGIVPRCRSSFFIVRTGQIQPGSVLLKAVV